MPPGRPNVTAERGYGRFHFRQCSFTISVGAGACRASQHFGCGRYSQQHHRADGNLARPTQDAVTLLEREAGTSFDPELVQKFVALLPQILAVREK
jgi:hypothetical protein